MPAQGDDLADGRQSVADPLDDGEILLANKEDLGFGVVDDVQHLRWREAPVDRDHHGIGLGGTEQQLEEEIAALVEMGDAHLRLDVRGDKAIGHPVRPTIEASIGRRAPFVDDGGGVRPPGGVNADDIGETCHLEVHHLEAH